jgi:hypothetical protein
MTVTVRRLTPPAAACALALAFVLAPAATARGQTTTPRPAASGDACDTLVHRPGLGLSDHNSDFARAAELIGAAPLHSRIIRRPSSEPALRRCTLLPDDPRRGDGSSLRYGITAAPWAETWVEESETGSGLRVELLPLTLTSFYNTAYPVDRNNGVLWAGRGLSAALGAGVTGRWGPISAGLNPQLVMQQNRDFEINTSIQPPGYSPFVYPWHTGKLDWPQRFGDRPFREYDLGQSFIRVDAYGAALGFSNENLWWGPAQRNPLLMSNTAPGFPHLFLGTSRPLGTPVGAFEGQLIWGRLSTSDHYMGDVDHGRLFAGIIGSYEPRGVPGLYLGFARAFMRMIPPDGLSAAEWLLEPYKMINTNHVEAWDGFGEDQVISLFFRWAHPAAGFEAYGEWAREDHWEDFADLVKELDHSSGFTLGLLKVLWVGDDWLRIAGEITNLGSSPTFQTRFRPTFYIHNRVTPGYTHRGRMLGASIGPGSDAQYLGADLFTKNGMTGIFVERVRRDDDAYYVYWPRYYGYMGHDVELAVGARQALILGDLQLDAGLAYRHRYNRNFIGLDGFNFELREETNWTLQLGARWSPDLRLGTTRRPPRPVSSAREES